MNCEKCKAKLEVSHTYSAPGGKTQRLECPECLTVHTAITVLVNNDPDKGEGAAALAKKMEREGAKWSLTF